MAWKPGSCVYTVQMGGVFFNFYFFKHQGLEPSGGSLNLGLGWKRVSLGECSFLSAFYENRSMQTSHTVERRVAAGPWRAGSAGLLI